MDRKPRLSLLLLLPALLGACNNGGGGDEPVVLTASCKPMPAGTGSRVYLDCNSSSGNMVSIDVTAADVPDEFDGYNIVVSFSPGVFQYRGFVTTAQPFGSVCNAADGKLLCTDNVSVANNTGLVVYAVTVTMNNPGVTLGAGGKAVLGTLMFEAVGAGNTNPAFSMPVTTSQCVGASVSGTALLSRDPLCVPLEVRTVAASFSNSSLALTATAPAP